MSALHTLIMLVAISVGVVGGGIAAGWLTLRVLRIPFGPPNIIGIVLFLIIVVVTMIEFVIYMEKQFR